MWRVSPNLYTTTTVLGITRILRSVETGIKVLTVGSITQECRTVRTLGMWRTVYSKTKIFSFLSLIMEENMSGKEINTFCWQKESVEKKGRKRYVVLTGTKTEKKRWTTSKEQSKPLKKVGWPFKRENEIVLVKTRTKLNVNVGYRLA